LRVPAALRVPVEALRAVPPVAAPDVEDARLAVLRDFVAAVLRVPVDAALRVPLALRVAPAFRVAVLDVARRAVEPDELELLLSSSDHLPDMTRCAASATASAISDPSRPALETIVLAAACAVSAASRPASRILRRAAGLALMAAAAAANPAASISRLIAAFASLSSVSSEPDDFFLSDFAIAILPSRKRHFSSREVPFRATNEWAQWGI